MVSPVIINETLTENQSVRFLIEDDPQFGSLRKADLSSYEKGILIADEALRDNWWPKLKGALTEKIAVSGEYFLPAGESSKDLASYGRLVRFLAQQKCSRDSLIIAIGGGTILDVASYTASTYMRGIPLLMIPTTLIGQADAATAGKTCLNTKDGKNLLGTLYLPKIVYNNVRILQTNSSYHLRQGFSEIFKYALLGSGDLLNLLKQFKEAPKNTSLLTSLLEETIKVRIRIRKGDPLASNLGHTFGHALEKDSNYAVNHGDAVAAGTVMALEFAAERMLMSADLKNKLVTLMEGLELNTKVQSNIDPKRMTETMRSDKKSSNSCIRLVLIRDIAQPLETDGRPFYPVEPSVIFDFLKRYLVNSDHVRDWHWKSLLEVA